MVSSKGQLGFEMIWIVLVLVVVGIGLIYGASIFSELNDDIQADDDLSLEAQSFSQNVVGEYPSGMDGVFFFLLIMLWIFLLISAFLADTSPIFLVITVILIVFGLVVTMILSNTYTEITEDETLNSFADNFPKMNFVLEHLLAVVVLMAFSTMLVLYGRTQL